MPGYARDALRVPTTAVDVGIALALSSGRAEARSGSVGRADGSERLASLAGRPCEGLFRELARQRMVEVGCEVLPVSKISGVRLHQSVS
jgi:hypothetical protein